MITVKSSLFEDDVNITGLSTDDKPLILEKSDRVVYTPNGATFFEMDTKKVFMFDAENKQWREI